MDPQNERRKQACRRVTDHELVTIISSLRVGSTKYPTAGVAADDYELELERRFSVHMAIFGLG